MKGLLFNETWATHTHAHTHCGFMGQLLIPDGEETPSVHHGKMIF